MAIDIVSARFYSFITEPNDLLVKMEDNNNKNLTKSK